MMHSLRAVIAEAAPLARKLDVAMLVVAHSDGPKLVFFESGGPGVEAELEHYIDTGGVPIGIVGWRKFAGLLPIYVVPFVRTPAAYGSELLYQHLLDATADLAVQLLSHSGSRPFKVDHQLN